MTERIEQRQSMNSLCTAIKVFVQKGDFTSDKTEKFYAEAGLRLIKLKKRLKESRHNEPWRVYVKSHCGLSQQRASELMRLANGEITLTKMRADKATSVAKSKAKRTTSSGRSSRKSTDTSAASPGATFPPFEPGQGCDFDSTSQARDDSEPYRVTRARGYFASINEATRLAQDNLFAVENKAEWAQLDPTEVTDEVISAAERVAEAWAECAIKLRQLRKGAVNGKKENTVGQALH